MTPCAHPHLLGGLCPKSGDDRRNNRIDNPAASALTSRRVEVVTDEGRVSVCVDIAPDDEYFSVTLSARDREDAVLAMVLVSRGYRLSRSSAVAWVEAGCPRFDVKIAKDLVFTRVGCY